MSFRSLVIRAAGTNCDEETVAALEAAGSVTDLIHFNALVEQPRLLDEVGLVAFGGGFSYGDDVASGAVYSHSLRMRLLESLQEFVSRGRFVIGICNGFQVLVRLGLLPGGDGAVALVDNLSGRYEDRWVRLRASTPVGPWFEANKEYLMPVAHAEGRFEWFPSLPDAPFPERQVALRYVGARREGGRTPYPENPNGSDDDIAAITNQAGNVLGLMPHPERFLLPTQHPYWTRFRRGDGSPPNEADLPVPLGLDLFRRVVATG